MVFFQEITAKYLKAVSHTVFQRVFPGQSGLFLLDLQPPDTGEFTLVQGQQGDDAAAAADFQGRVVSSG